MALMSLKLSVLDLRIPQKNVKGINTLPLLTKGSNLIVVAAILLELFMFLELLPLLLFLTSVHSTLTEDTRERRLMKNSKFKLIVQFRNTLNFQAKIHLVIIHDT